MLRVYEGYERRKQSDAARSTSRTCWGSRCRCSTGTRRRPTAVRARFHAFTVDEYQDVNPLQEALLDRWLGEREDLCVVGDDYQTIYSFTGASPGYLLGFTDRFPSATVVRLERNYRSTPESCGFANELAGHLGGFRKTLRGDPSESGPPVARAAADDARTRSRPSSRPWASSAREGVPLEEIAVLYRINARSEPFEEAFAAAGIPYQVRDGAFLRRPGPRVGAATVEAPRRPDPSTDVVERRHRRVRVRSRDAPDSDEEVTRQADLARLRALAEEFDGAHDRRRRRRVRRGARPPVLDRAQRPRRQPADVPPSEGAGVRRGVPASAARRRAPRSARGRAKADPDEERRLLYVGITRARTLPVPHVANRRQDEAQPVPGRARRADAVAPRGAPVVRAHPPAEGRRAGVRPAEGLAEVAREGGRRPRLRVFHDKTLEEIADLLPKDWADLAAISGVGPTKLERYGDEVLAVVATV